MNILTDVVDVLFLIENCGLLLLGWKGWKMFKSPAGSLLGAAVVTDLSMKSFKVPGE